MADPDLVLIDTSAFYALISDTDEFHTSATNIYTRLLHDRRDLWTTSYILAEFYALVERRLGFDLLKGFVESTIGVFDTVWVEQTLHNEAWNAFLEREGKGLNFVDCTTLATAKRLRAAIFTFDRDFRREGVAVLP